ncbi:MAG: hypothetical protein WAM42_19255 [Candidatus Nitrosopolaris sp.]
MLPMKHYDQIHNIRKPNDMQSSLLPMHCLLAILGHDKQIRERFSTWIHDLARYQEEILRTIDDFHKKII